MCRQFQHQGMIDGTFPSVTFSKENKKIVTLTEREIQTRLMKVLNELSLRGCLGVLLACLGDDCDLEVVKEASSVIERLMSYLNKYAFLDYYQNLSSAPGSGGSSSTTPTSGSPARKLESSSSTSATVSSSYVSTTSVMQETSAETGGTTIAAGGDTKSPDQSLESAPRRRNDADYSSANLACRTAIADEIIDSIVNLNDMNLLSVTYNPHVTVGAPSSGDDCGCEPSLQHADLFHQYAAVTPEHFLQRVRSIDLPAMVSSRERWLKQTESFGSLLDDVLFSYYAADVNDADCY
ncbi:uncharacterized protein LOC128277062 [Anopheles cruzii]|uniref:uncharacterized protein LOC128277062 n=1 Tax=Anopheles cruzii TaxID=68878 RepID=UPI0022EC8B16|nr:uncharacterized protein LOC128277062 [Anopheles cruzii]